jgi:hypothetical protein
MMVDKKSREIYRERGGRGREILREETIERYIDKAEEKNY